MKEQRTIIQLVSEVHTLHKGLKRVIIYRLRLASFPGHLTPASVLQATNAGGEGLEARLSLDLLQANLQLMSPFSEYRWIFCVFDSSRKFYGDRMQSCAKTVSCMC